jgi:heme-degrading monooxygenase HmoA
MSRSGQPKGVDVVVEYIRYRIPAGHQARFEAAYRDAAGSLDASGHCLAYELSHGVEESERYILRIEWDSLEGHEQGFRRSPEFRRFFAAVRPFVDQIEEMRHYNVTPIGTSG